MIRSILVCSLSWALVACEAPSTESLDKDLELVRGQLDSVNADIENYPGGAIRATLESRKQVLLNTEAMLVQKRNAILYRINMDYVVDGVRIQPASDAALASLATEIDQEERRIHEMQLEAEGSGGLIGGMKQLNVAAEQLILAQLRHRYITAKYGLPEMQRTDAQTDASEDPELTQDPRLRTDLEDVL
jgi:hypothetical protein